MPTILVIDDHRDILEMLSFMLEEEGYEVLTAKSGQVGIRLASELEPDIILCDVMMPGMNGYEVYEKVREDPDLALTPFVFLTAKAGHEDIRAGMRLGADDYLSKPFEPDELLRVIETQLRKYHTIEEQQGQKLDQLRQGLSTILPHELRTPLSIVLSHTSLLLEAYDTFDRTAVLDMVRGIHEAGERLHRLVENLLLYVEMEGNASLRLEHPFTSDAQHVMIEAAVRQARTYGREDDLHLSVAQGALAMHPFHLRKITEELADNAFKFSSRRTPVRVEAYGREGALCLQVMDQGVGMTREQIEQIGAYVQFERARLEQRGGGLGLAICQRLTELYHGTFSVRATPGEGTTVEVHVPGIWQDPA